MKSDTQWFWDNIQKQYDAMSPEDKAWLAAEDEKRRKHREEAVRKVMEQRGAKKWLIIE